MGQKLFGKSGLLWKLLIVIQLQYINCSSLQVNQNYFGVFFDPFVKQAENGNGSPNVWAYEFENVKTMLTVISMRFSRVYVRDTFSGQESYRYNYTYKHQSLVNLYTGEAAAMINNESGKKLLTVIYEVVRLDSANQHETAIQLAFEAAEKANRIFSNTVEGVVINDIGLTSQEQLQSVRQHRGRASELDIKLGATLDCIALLKESNIKPPIKKQIINESDLIQCPIYCDETRIVPAECFNAVTNSFLKVKDVAYTISKSTQVIGMARWVNFGLNEREMNLKKCWQKANNWASHHKFKIFLVEAIDKPSKTDPAERHRGWWKLTDNSKINLVEGYVEKIYEEDNLPTTTYPEKEKEIVSTTDSSAKGGDNDLPSNSPDKEKSKNTGSEPSGTAWKDVIITIAVTGGITLIAVTALLLYFLVLRKEKSTVLTESEVRDFMSGEINTAHDAGDRTVLETTIGSAYDTSLEIPKDKLRIDGNKVLGSGQFGLVLRAWIESSEEDDVEVALKVAKNNCSPTGLKGLLAEIKIMTYLGKHANIIVIKGAYTAELAQGIVYIATELCALGSLKGYLDKNSSMEENVDGPYMSLCQSQEMELASSIPLSEMIRWSHEIACGMEYLEKKHVVHADLAARNILLTAEKTAKISDFGLSRRMYNYINYIKTQQEPLPWRWMAIEALKKNEFSSKSDVWSYGITLWEIFSKGDTPYPGLSWSQSYVTRLVNGLRPDCPPHATPEICNFMRDCWNFNPKDRPSFSELVSFTKVAMKKCDAAFAGESE